jgi:hypothetical protein
MCWIAVLARASQTGFAGGPILALERAVEQTLSRRMVTILDI